jgi:5-methylthioadenosine/S-adenosylhomocysteine deaminase
LGRPTDIVEAAWVQGRQLINQGQLLTVDIATLHSTLRGQPIAIEGAQSQHHSVESHYRDVMLKR